MRVKRQKGVRRAVTFYKTCFGFRDPFKVLCDGNFVHAVLTARIGPLNEALSTLLGAGAKPFVTRCVIGELRKLGEDFSGTVLAARRLDIAKCNHEPLLPAIDCIEAMIGKNNPEHFFVSTQDPVLRQKLRKVPGGALIFLQNTALILEQPSSQQLLYARLSETERLHMSTDEEKVLEARAKRKAADSGNNSLLPDNGNDKKQVPKLKRKRAKGPNPLSQKKKQKKSPVGPNLVPGKGEGATEGLMKKRKRQRHRTHHRKTGDEPVLVGN